MAINITGGLDAGITVETDPTVPSASTTAAGKVELATNAETQTGSSTTLAVTPASLAFAKYSQSYYRLSGQVWAFATSGTGASASMLNGMPRVIAPTSATGYGFSNQALPAHARNVTGTSNGFIWSKRFEARFRFGIRTVGTDANTVSRVTFGKVTGSTTGDLANMGVGIKQVANGVLQLMVHNGTTLTSVNSSLTPTANSWYDIAIISDGSGNVTLYNNDSSIATTALGPTGNAGTNQHYVTVEAENLATITGTANSIFVSEMTLEFSIA